MKCVVAQKKEERKMMKKMSTNNQRQIVEVDWRSENLYKKKSKKQHTNWKKEKPTESSSAVPLLINSATARI